MTQSFDTGSLASKAPSGRAGGKAAGRRPRPVAGGALAAAGLLISACTALPEWADPGGWFEEEAPPPSRISAAQNLDQAQSGEFPNLASVPDAPRQVTSDAERTAIADALEADRANARYSGERLTAGVAKAPAGAPTAPEIAQDLSVTATPAPAEPPTAAETMDTARGATMIAPSPGPAPGAARTAAPAQAGGPVVAPGLAALAQAPARAPTQALRSELAGIIYFAHGSDTLDANDRAVLRDIVALSRERGAAIRVVGHASARTGTVDPVEHQMANLEISQRRADSVAAALIRLGATRDRVRIEAQADSLPVYHEFMPTGEAGNRRAEIFLEY